MTLQQIIDKLKAISEELDHRDPRPRDAIVEIACATGHLLLARAELAKAAAANGEQVAEPDIQF